MAPKKFRRQILTQKTKEDNKITLKDWNSYLKNIYESLDVIDNIHTLLKTKQVFSLQEKYLGVKVLENRKYKDNEGYQT